MLQNELIKQIGVILSRVFRIVRFRRLSASFQINQDELIFVGERLNEVSPRIRAGAKAVDAEQRIALAVDFVMEFDRDRGPPLVRFLWGMLTQVNTNKVRGR